MAKEEKINEFGELVKLSKRVLIFMHDFPDPDALGAALGMKKLIEDKFEKTVLLFGFGYSRQMNRVMANVLNIELKEAPKMLRSTDTKDPSDFVLFVDVNELSGNFRFKNETGLKPDWTIDHHIDKDKPLNGTAHLEPVGSSCTIVAEYLQHFEVELDKEDPQDKNVAVGLMLGIETDTNNLKSASATARDTKAFEYAKKYYDPEIYAQISDFELNGYYFDLLKLARENTIREGSLIVVNLGYLTSDQEGALSFIADLWRRWKDTRVVITFAVINNQVTGKVRVRGTNDIKASELARQVFMAPDGGGHNHMAGATAPLGPFFDVDLLTEEAKSDYLHGVTEIIVKRAKKLSQE